MSFDATRTKLDRQWLQLSDTYIRNGLKRARIMKKCSEIIGIIVGQEVDCN